MERRGGSPRAWRAARPKRPGSRSSTPTCGRRAISPPRCSRTRGRRISRPSARRRAWSSPAPPRRSSTPRCWQRWSTASDFPAAWRPRPRRVQANGQCFFAKRSVLVASGAIAGARASRCEDVTIARRLVRAGVAVGFFEGGRWATVRMYEGLEECWRNWPRSLTMRDAETSNVELLLELADARSSRPCRSRSRPSRSRAGSAVRWPP